MQVLGHTKLSSSASFIEFSSISGDYDHLLLYGSLRGTINNTATLDIWYNADKTASSYNSYFRYGSSTAVSSFTYNSSTFVKGGCSSSNSGSGEFSLVRFVLPNYKSSINPKSLHGYTFAYTEGSYEGYSGLAHQIYASSNAITNIRITQATGALAAGTELTLIGIVGGSDGTTTAT